MQNSEHLGEHFAFDMCEIFNWRMTNKLLNQWGQTEVTRI